MAHLAFTPNLARQTHCPDATLSAGTVALLFNQYFTRHTAVRSFVLDDQGAVRKHIMVLVDGLNLRDRLSLSDALTPESEVFVFQALSGG